VIAKEWLSRRTYVACMAAVAVFTPLTLGTILFVLPLVFHPQAVTHSCRRCGLRLAIATGAAGELGYTVPMDVDDEHFVPAPDDWRPHLARLPGGMRVARSPLGAPPEISEREMKACDTRFVKSRPLRRLRLLADNTMDHIVRCILDDDKNGGDGGGIDAEVLYEIHASGVRTLINSPDTTDAHIKVQMRSPPAEDVAAVGLPPYTKDMEPTDATHVPSVSSRAPVFTQACRYQLFANEKRKYSSVMFLAGASGHGETAYINPVHARYRAFFWAAKPIWRWHSSQGALLWMSRRYRDAEMAAFDTRLCLMDDYDRLLAVVDGWDGLSLLCAVDDSFAQYTQRPSIPGFKSSTITLYADLDAQLLGEVLGSLCVLAVQVRRVTAEFKKENEERKRNTRQIY